LSKIAYGATAALTVAVVVELLHASVLLIFALTSLALVRLAWVLGQATESLAKWLEGTMLCGVYAIAALAFFFSP
jgi:Ca2+/H+ antiporter